MAVEPIDNILKRFKNEYVIIRVLTLINTASHWPGN